MPVERGLVQRLIEWAAPWYDPAIDDARSAAVDAAVTDAELSAGEADKAIRRHRDDLRDSFRRAGDRLGRDE